MSATPPAAVREIPLGAETASALLAFATSIGFDATRVDLSGCDDKDSFLGRTAQALAFPAWFGRNWDAFYDCLADLSWRPAPGYLLLFDHADAMRRLAPEALDTALAILDDAAGAWRARGVPMRIFVAAAPGNAGR